MDETRREGGCDGWREGCIGAVSTNEAGTPQRRGARLGAALRGLPSLSLSLLCAVEAHHPCAAVGQCAQTATASVRKRTAEARERIWLRVQCSRQRLQAGSMGRGATTALKIEVLFAELFSCPEEHASVSNKHMRVWPEQSSILHESGKVLKWFHRE